MSKIIQPPGAIDRTLSKQEIIEFAEAHAAQVIDKGYDLLKVYVELKRYQLYLDTIIKALKTEAVEVAKQQSKKSFNYSNARIQVHNRTKYNYESDKKWVELNTQLELLKEERKKREQLLKSIVGEYKEIVDTETGEVEQLIAPLKEVLDQIVVRL